LNKTSWWGKVSYWLPVVFLSVGRMRLWHSEIRPTLDGSWHLGLNLLAASPYRFGRDVVFSYGPLGHLLVALPVAGNLAQAALFWGVIHLVFIGLVILLRRRIRSDAGFWLFAIAFSAAASLGITSEYYLLLLLGMLALLSVRARPRGWVLAFLAGMLVAISFFIKLSLGIAGIVLFLSCGAVWTWQRRPETARSLAAWAVGFLGLSALLGAKLLDSWKSLETWWAASRDLAGDFTVGMSTVGPPEILVTGVLVLVVMARLLERRWRKRWDLAALAAWGSLFAFKHGFGRQDQHVVPFFSFVLGLISLFLLLAEDRAERRRAAVAFLLVGVLSIPALLRYDPYALRDFPSGLCGLGGVSQLSQLAQFRRTEARLREEGERALRSSRLDETILQPMASGGPVGVVPWDIGLIYANRLSWRPCPVFQTFMAFTGYLDRLNGNFFRGVSAPPFVLAVYTDIDDRNPLQATPATWQALLDNYDLTAGPDPQGRMLLTRRTNARTPNYRDSGVTASAVDRWVEVPPGGLVRDVRVWMRLNPIGRLARILFRVPPLKIEMEMESGETASYRFLAATAPNGIRVRSVVESSRDLVELFNGGQGPAIRRFRIFGAGAVYYHREIRLIWVESADR
jgi:hypothetical protein